MWVLCQRLVDATILEAHLMCFPLVCNTRCQLLIELLTKNDKKKKFILLPVRKSSLIIRKKYYSKKITLQINFKQIKATHIFKTKQIQPRVSNNNNNNKKTTPRQPQTGLWPN